jgi:hypothetical protein
MNTIYLRSLMSSERHAYIRADPKTPKYKLTSEEHFRGSDVN